MSEIPKPEVLSRKEQHARAISLITDINTGLLHTPEFQKAAAKKVLGMKIEKGVTFSEEGRTHNYFLWRMNRRQDVDYTIEAKGSITHYNISAGEGDFANFTWGTITRNENGKICSGQEAEELLRLDLDGIISRGKTQSKPVRGGGWVSD